MQSTFSDGKSEFEFWFTLLFPNKVRRLLDHEFFKNLEFFPQVGNHRLFRLRKKLT